MCTCGIDIATQQATPATHSSAAQRRGDRPNGRSTWHAGVRLPRRVRQRRRPAPQQRARAAPSLATQNTPSADVGRAPADGLEEVLQDRRPDRAGEVVAARADRHRDAAPAVEPQRGVGDQRREVGRAAEQADQQAVRERELPAGCRRCPPRRSPRPGRPRRSAPAPSRRSGRRAGPSGCRRGRSRSSSACRAATRRRARRRTRPAPRAARPRSTYMPTPPMVISASDDAEPQPGVGGFGQLDTSRR